MKIKANSDLIKNIKLSVPYDGTIEVDENGVVEVSQSCAEILVNGTHDWHYLDDTKGAIDDADINSLLNKIKSAPLEELVSIAKEAGYDEKEWSKFAKNSKSAQKLMSGYLIKKFNEASEVESDEVKDETPVTEENPDAEKKDETADDKTSK